MSAKYGRVATSFLDVAAVAKLARSAMSTKMAPHPQAKLPRQRQSFIAEITEGGDADQPERNGTNRGVFYRRAKVRFKLFEDKVQRVAGNGANPGRPIELHGLLRKCARLARAFYPPGLEEPEFAEKMAISDKMAVGHRTCEGWRLAGKDIRSPRCTITRPRGPAA